MNIILLPPSDIELDEAIEYYNSQQKDLGYRFYEEFIKSTNMIKPYPKTWRKVGKHTHRINIKKFPYLFLYVIDETNIIITCIAHQHRNPSYYVDKIY